VLEDAQQRFYTPNKNLDQVGMFQFLEHLRERLPPLLPYFRESGSSEELDWRLLAAMGYQESNWDPDAASYTGVRGIMMLTNRTAAQLGIDNRLDPEQSIAGGARYIRDLRSRIPSRIAEPDRTWMALAAYNMGMGHLEDARVLTQIQNMNPDSWADVRQSLDLLSQEQWHQRTQNGYARGFEARQYVHNISKYLEVLVWMDTRAHPLLAAGNK
jgi:membrane-bound lytic murein transglycosylase F